MKRPQGGLFQSYITQAFHEKERGCREDILFLFWRRWRDFELRLCAKIVLVQSFHTQSPVKSLRLFESSNPQTFNKDKKGCPMGIPFHLWRRWRDLNSRGAINTLPHFECGPFSHLGTSPYNGTIIHATGWICQPPMRHNPFKYPYNKEKY